MSAGSLYFAPWAGMVTTGGRFHTRVLLNLNISKRGKSGWTSICTTDLPGGWRTCTWCLMGAQSIKAMWMKKGEAMDPDAHTYNRYSLLQQKLTQSDGIAWPAWLSCLVWYKEYGSQLGTKVPLWGGFNAQGGLCLRLWTNTAKMNADEWMEHVPALTRAASQAGAGHGLSCCICVCLAIS